ncbi:MAG: TlpA family protein disulfide reductase [Phycisphaerales bacterium]|nr:TlpA family protein disulfide reductase [Phycisphaerales bacterium]
MRTRCLSLILVGLFAGLVYGQMPSHPVPGQIAPDVHADDLQQAPDWMQPGEINLAEFRGKVVYLKFWSTGCLPCVQAMPRHNELKKKYGDKLVFLGVTPQTLDDIADFMGSHETSMIVLSDPDNTTWWRYYPPGQGSGALICPDGRVSRVSVDDLDLDEEMIEMALRGEYEDGPPIDWNGEILPHARALGSDWGKPWDEMKGLSGQDPYSLAEEATFQIICRPAWPNGRFYGHGTGDDRFTRLTSQALWIIQGAVRVTGFDELGMQTPRNRVIGPEWLDERYFDFIYNLPGIDDLLRKQLIEAAIESGMGIEITRERREVDGYRIEWVDPEKKLPESTNPYVQWLGMSDMGDGRPGADVRKYTLSHLGKRLEERLSVPVVSDDDSGGYDFIIPSPVSATIDEIGMYLQLEYGVRIVPDVVEIEVLVVREKQTIGG